MNFTYLLGSLKSLGEVIYAKEIDSGFRPTHPRSSPSPWPREPYTQESMGDALHFLKLITRQAHDFLLSCLPTSGLLWRTWHRIKASSFLYPHLNLEFGFAEKTLKLLTYPASWVRKFFPPTQSQAEGGKLWAGKMSEFFEADRPAAPAECALPHGGKSLREGRGLWTVLQDAVTWSSEPWSSECLWL